MLVPRRFRDWWISYKGMQEIGEFVDDRNKGWCIHCARSLLDSPITRDHIPTKTLLHPPYPPNLPIVRICQSCNQSFSANEQYLVALLSVVQAGCSDPKKQKNINAQRILAYNHRLRAAIESSRSEQLDFWEPSKITWKVEEERVRKVVLKNARGHAFYEYGEPMMDDPVGVSLMLLPSMSSADRASFEDVPSSGLWPEVGSRMMTRLITGQDLNGPWIIVQDLIYRYSVSQVAGGLLVRSVLNEYLGTEVFWG